MKNILLTGQSGLKKKEYIDEVRTILSNSGHCLECESIGKMMIDNYQGKINEKKILNVHKSELDLLRRSSWKDIIYKQNQLQSCDYFILDTHAVFRWHHGLVPTLDLDQVLSYEPDLCVCLIDDMKSIKRGLKERETDILDFWELFAWREEEIWISKIIIESVSKLLEKEIPFYILPKAQGPTLLSNLLTKPDIPKVYLSFPITGLSDEEFKDVDEFKNNVKKKFISFDPFSVKDRELTTMYYTLEEEIAEEATDITNLINERKNESQSKIWQFHTEKWTPLSLTEFNVEGFKILGRELHSVLEAIDSQIISRDYRLIDQSDFIVVYIKEDGDLPKISAGCQAEVIYAYSTGKDVYVIFKGGEKKLSPWVTQYSNVFINLKECLEFLNQKYFN
jgi:adenylate kinase